jgi:hypothetical protein
VNERLVLLLRIAEAAASKQGTETGYLDCDFPWFYLIASGKYSDIASNYVTIDSFHILSNLSFTNHLPL